MTQESSPSAPARQELARFLDQTLRRGDATAREIQALCDEARAQGLFGVCVNSARVAQAAHGLEDSGLQVICAVGFPLGAADTDTKRFETEAAIDSGAHLVELSANLGELKDGDEAAVLRELRDVVEAADERPVSVRFDPELLRAGETDRLCRLAVEAGAKGLTIPARTGVAAAVQAVNTVRTAVGDALPVRIDGEALDLAGLAALLKAGVKRFGLANAVELLGMLPPAH